MRIFSGIQPTGDKHLGNYSAAFRQYAATQEQGDGVLLHRRPALDHDGDYDPDELREATLALAAMLFATGLDPERSTVFAQSHVDRARRGGLAARLGHELRRAAPDDAVQGQGASSRTSSRPGLFTYPVLMAADILLYQTDIVPVGDDQRQHIELARNVAERFNSALRRDVRRAATA